MAWRRASQSIAYAVLLLFAFPLRGDVLILRDGSRVTGKLTFCDEETCSINKRRIPLDQIRQIGLGASPKLPSGRRGGNIVLTDSTIRQGRFTGLNAGYVFIDEDEIERDLVAAIIPGLPGQPAADVVIASDGSSRRETLERFEPRALETFAAQIIHPRRHTRVPDLFCCAEIGKGTSELRLLTGTGSTLAARQSHAGIDREGCTIIPRDW